MKVYVAFILFMAVMVSTNGFAHQPATGELLFNLFGFWLVYILPVQVWRDIKKKKSVPSQVQDVDDILPPEKN
jgi:hypothetical protein